MSINYVDKEINYTTMLGYVDVAVKNSFGKSGRYHKYLQDYTETLCLLSMFTDYEVKATTQEELLEEMLDIYHSDEWKNDILPKIGEKYNTFHGYVCDEINQALRPLGRFDDMMNSAKELIDAIGDLIKAVDPEALKNMNLDEILNALNEIGEVYNTASETEEDETIDNVVKLNK